MTGGANCGLTDTLTVAGNPGFTDTLTAAGNPGFTDTLTAAGNPGFTDTLTAAGNPGFTDTHYTNESGPCLDNRMGQPIVVGAGATGLVVDRRLIPAGQMSARRSNRIDSRP